MPYRSTDYTRRKKDAKRAAMMQAALRVFAEKGYHTATIRDIVGSADVAVGTFYFYFPDKETLFVYLYDETADFLVQAVQQAINTRKTFVRQVAAAVQAYVNLALYEPAIVNLLLVSGVGAVATLVERRAAFRQRLVAAWQKPLEEALAAGQIAPQDTRRSAQGVAGALDEMILSLLEQPDPEREAAAAVEDISQFVLRAAGFRG
ncbi:MAG: TetR/AcrR family transcriptional regulator [Candidatus Promineifilaceae bacterium]|nr:TetR/AcrR family transcriptional regulator [Candidatus Promineifilaceae bacterium]